MRGCRSPARRAHPPGARGLTSGALEMRALRCLGRAPLRPLQSLPAAGQRLLRGGVSAGLARGLSAAALARGLSAALAARGPAVPVTHWGLPFRSVASVFGIQLWIQPHQTPPDGGFVCCDESGGRGGPARKQRHAAGATLGLSPKAYSALQRGAREAAPARQGAGPRALAAGTRRPPERSLMQQVGRSRRNAVRRVSFCRWPIMAECVCRLSHGICCIA